jgi:hypothetical protein
MNNPANEWREEFAKTLSQKVRYFCGEGQYEKGSQEQQAYIDGVETAIGMMYIDLTGTPKTEGMLQNLTTLTTAIKEAECCLCKDKGVIELIEEAKREAMEESDDLLDDMWGLICNVNGGIVENERPEWYGAFLRIREKYFKYITPNPPSH